MTFIFVIVTQVSIFNQKSEQFTDRVQSARDIQKQVLKDVWKLKIFKKERYGIKERVND